MNQKQFLESRNYFIDEVVLKEEGETDLDKYSVVPGAELMDDFFI